MAKTMYFGTRERMTWVKAPAIEAGLSRARWGTSGVYLNGGAYVRQSNTGHKKYSFSWGMTAQENIYTIVDYADGLYGTGLMHFHDPFAMGVNVFSQAWAAPSLAGTDAPSLIEGIRPTLSPTPDNNYAYPSNSAVYTLLADSSVNEFLIPVPAGYTLHVGVHGSATGSAAINIRSLDGDEVGGLLPGEFTLPGAGTLVTDVLAATPLTMLPVTTPQLTNYSVSGIPWAAISLQGVGQLTLSGLIAQVLPNSDSPLVGSFKSGRGHSGCRFDPNQPTVSGFSAPSALDMVSASATLTETGAWEDN